MKLTSKCGEEIIRKSPDRIVSHYEALGYRAERDKDYCNMHLYFQHSEHYKKLI